MPATSAGRLAGSEGMRAQLAAIHIGGSSASMLIAERTEDRKAPLRLLEFLEQPLPLASDVFERGALSPATIERCVAIVRRFQEALLDYGMARVEAGAQGQHKLQRGYEPTPTYSAHWIRDPALHSAVARFLGQERRAMSLEAERLRELLPYRQS